MKWRKSAIKWIFAICIISLVGITRNNMIHRLLLILLKIIDTVWTHISYNWMIDLQLQSFSENHYRRFRESEIDALAACIVHRYPINSRACKSIFFLTNFCAYKNGLGTILADSSTFLSFYQSFYNCNRNQNKTCKTRNN